MEIYWKCGCGETFDEPAVEKGYFDKRYLDAALEHANQHEIDGLPERIIGLFGKEGDQEALLMRGTNPREAINKSLLPPPKPGDDNEEEDETNEKEEPDKKEEKQKRAKNAPNTQYLAQGEIIPVKITVPAMLLNFFFEAQAMCPEQYPDNSPETISDWLTECVMGFYNVWARLAVYGDSPVTPFMGRLTMMVNAIPDILDKVEEMGGMEAVVAKLEKARLEEEAEYVK